MKRVTDNQTKRTWQHNEDKRNDMNMDLTSTKRSKTDSESSCSPIIKKEKGIIFIPSKSSPSHQVLEFRDVSLTVPISTCSCWPINDLKPIHSTRTGDAKQKSTRRTILNAISGQVCSGELMAILGPSGAGKTSLLKIITLQNFHRKYYSTAGSVRLNGRDMSMDMFKEKCAIVEQYDTLWPILTTTEHLKYAADFIFSSGRDDNNTCTFQHKQAKIDDLLDTLDLQDCVDTRASKLSGGQRRRLSLAIAMIKAPQVLFLDEPTSGLDAVSAAKVVASLKLLAQKNNIMVICTIHQPSTTVFAAFSHVTLLSKGNLVYSGKNGDNVLSYFEHAGYPALPVNINPAEYLLECISSSPISESSSFEHVSSVENQEQVEEWIDHHPRPMETQPVYDLSSTNDQNGRPTPPNIFTETMALTYRMFIISIRDFQAYFARGVFFCFVTIFISTFYLQTRDRTLEFAVERVIQIGWFFAVPSLLMIVHVYQSCIEHVNMAHEVRLGFYRPISFGLARVLVEIPFIFLLSFAALGVGGFVVGRFNGAAFFMLILLYTSMLYSFEALAQVCSMAFIDTNMNMLLFVIIWFGSFLFSEIWVAERDVILAFRPFFYLSPFRLSFRAFAFLDFQDANFSCGEGLSLIQGMNGGMKCVGEYDGNSLLDAIGNIVFPTVTSNVDVVWCLGVTTFIALALKVVYISLNSYRLSITTTITRVVDRKGKIAGAKYLKSGLAIVLVVGAFTGICIWMASEDKLYGAQECMKNLNDIGYSLTDFENYSKFFNDDSVMILPQAGSYTGPASILEYVLFLAGAATAVIRESSSLRCDRRFMKYNEESGTCSFQDLCLVEGMLINPLIKRFSTKISYTAMTHFELNPEIQVIESVFVDFEERFLSFIFGEAAKSDVTREFVCSVMADACSVTLDEENCIEKLAALPVTEGPLSHFDGNSQACRFLHSTMALENDKHCAHIAFEPTLDEDGKIKCQESQGMLRTDFFEESDIEAHRRFQKNVGIVPGEGFKLHTSSDQ